MALRNISNIHQKPHPMAVYTMEQKTASVATTRKLINKPKNIEKNVQPQIRTSSPISSETSDSFDAPENTVFPVKHVSIRELAYEKLRQQKDIEKNNYKNKNVDISQIRSNGKLKILAFNNFGHLTVHIIKGKNYKVLGDTYVKINMLPDQEKFYKHYQTDTEKHAHRKQSQHTYDEKFSFEVNQANLNDRICVSVWAKPQNSKSNLNSLLSSGTSGSSISSSFNQNISKNIPISDLLVGCFSFRVKSLMTGLQNGLDSSEPQWYHLLPENLGVLKHYRCHRMITSKEQAANSNYHITDVHKDLIGMDRLKYELRRNHETESYGFTITGNCPCMVGKVDKTRKEYSGLRAGDFIASLNGKNVSRATCDSVVKLIKSFKTSFCIEVYREKENNLIVNDQKNGDNNQYFQSYNHKQVIRNQPMNENHYCEIPNPVTKSVVETPKIIHQFYPNKMNAYNLEVVPEEDEIESMGNSEESDIYGINNYSLVRFEAFEAYNGQEIIRHMDSDVNTEDDDERVENNGQEEEHLRAQMMRQCSLKYVQNNQNYRLMNEHHIY